MTREKILFAVMSSARQAARISAIQRHICSNDEDWPGVEVGWALHPDKWGLGYATEAGAESIRYAFEDLDEDCLFSTILPDNHRSQSVAKRLGFVLVETKVLSHYLHEPHGIWMIKR